MAGEKEKNERIGHVRDFKALSKRIGMHMGQSARTYHCHVRGVKVGIGSGAIDYLAREGDYGARKDLEHLAGIAQAVKDAVKAIDKGARIRRGPTAETVLKTMVFELPRDSTSETRRLVAEAVVERYESLGHRAVAAVHMPANDQPHIHVAIAARRIVDGEVDRHAGSVIMQTRHQLVKERVAVADLVNGICKQHDLFFAGRDKDMDQPGLEGRKPKRRIPERDYHADGVRENAPAVLAELRQQHEDARKQAAENAEHRQAEQETKKAAKLEKLDAVPRERHERALKVATEKQAELIERIAKAQKVKLPAGWQERLDGGDLMAALKKKEKGDQKAFEERLSAAVERANAAEEHGRNAEQWGVNTMDTLWQTNLELSKTTERADKAEREAQAAQSRAAQAEAKAAQLDAQLKALAKEHPPKPPAQEMPQVTGHRVWLHRTSTSKGRADLKTYLEKASDQQLAADRLANQDAIERMRAEHAARTRGDAAFQIEGLQGGLKAIEMTMQQRGLLQASPAAQRPVRGGNER